jgi:hypothetical protein
MAKHSSIIGGSNAGRLLNCPASHQAILALPPTTDVSSDYAEEGTAMHAVMDQILLRRQSNILMPHEMHLTAKSLLGIKFHDRVLTQEHLDTMITPALDHLIALEREYVTEGTAFFVVGVETRVKFPRLAGAFGTIDLVLQSDDCVLHVDWKFGSGVGVLMVYPTDGGTIVNPQLMFYIAAAKATQPKWYAGGRRIVGGIIQPRGADPLTHTVIERSEIRTFVDDVENAVLLAIGRNPPRQRGEHCRFAPCKVACPHWTGPLLDLSTLGPTPAREMNARPNIPSAYGAYLARAKVLVDSLAMLKADIDKQMHAYLEAGGTIPGWRLKAKAKQRQWADVTTVVPALKQLGFDDEDIWDSKLTTFQRADAVAKRLGVTIPEYLRVAPPTNETTIATTSDPAPVVEPHVAIEQFREALKALPGNEPAIRLVK